MSAKHESTAPQDFTVLEDTYNIVGELNARDNIRGYIATRIADGADVMILVEEQPPGDAGNALTHFAADANLLATLEHRNLIPIHDGRWLGPEAFALVTDRCAAPTLATLVARNESWSYPRIGTILHEVNGLLEWARQQKVVHRTLTLDTIHLEPATDRVLVSFVALPLKRTGPPGAEGDSHTIASLAWTLITRGRDLPATVDDSIGIVRPELPRRVIEATDALIHGKRVGETDPPDVLDYIGLVAMSDALRAGDSDAAELQAVVLHEQVLEREAWATTERDLNTRMEELERTVAEEREAMQRTLATEREEMQQTLATERETMERTLLDEREELTDTLASERQQLAESGAELERQLAAERADLEQEVATERASMEQELVSERQRFADGRAELESDIAAERVQLERQRADLEANVAAEREQLAASRTTGEQGLAAARAEFEDASRAQREEFERLLAAEREQFDSTIMAERNALEAEKEGLAVFHQAEREQIDAELRALEESYLAYEAEGHVIERGDADANDDGPPAEHDAPRRRGWLAALAPMAVAQPMSEPDSPAGYPAETETGQTRGDARRSRRAAWGIPAAIIALIAIIVASALGIGDGDQRSVDARIERDIERASQPTPGLTQGRTGAVLDSAGGTVGPGAAGPGTP